MKKAVFPGHELRRRREEMGLSVYEVFRNTRVPVEYIEALERGELRALPSVCYCIGFLKSYCTYIGLDAERFVDTFRSCSHPVPQGFLRRSLPTTRSATMPRWMDDLLTWGAVMAIVLLGWVTYTVLFAPSTDVLDKSVQAGTFDISTPPTPPEAP